MRFPVNSVKTIRNPVVNHKPLAVRQPAIAGWRPSKHSKGKKEKSR